MTATDAEDVQETQAFISSLRGLDTGARARLKRNAGRMLSEARDVFGIFYRMLPSDAKPYEYRWYFLVATLFPLGTETRRDRNFGVTLRIARQSMSGPALDRRVEALLDADSDQLPFRLRQAVRLVQSHRVGINWTRMLEDVLEWGAPHHRVQERWAVAYFGARPFRLTTNERSRV